MGNVRYSSMVDTLGKRTTRSERQKKGMVQNGGKAIQKQNKRDGGGDGSHEKRNSDLPKEEKKKNFRRDPRMY